MAIFIPRGMAHGFLALTDEAIFSYKCDALYNPQSEAGILYNDPTLDINWEMAEEELILSEKDLNLPLLKDLEL
jgi:dTDP-4-dehydrorhamnose 3,5-epimerase